MGTARDKPPHARLIFSQNLRRLRLAKGLSQEKLAALASLHPNYIGSVERGERNISIDNIESILRGASLLLFSPHLSLHGGQMGRRRESSEFDALRELLQTMPTWFGPVLAAAVYCLLRFVPAILMPAPKAGAPGFVFIMMMPTIALIVAMAIVAVWLTAELWKFQNRRLLDRQTGTDSIRQISWQEFERLVSEAYRRRGYVAEVVGCSAGDGGIDIRLTRGGQTTLVQCKQWRAWKVGVTAVRELLGVVVSQRASRGILVTSGRFTGEALAFAQANPTIELVDGEHLSQLIREVQADRTTTPTHPATTSPRVSEPSVPLNPEPRTLNPPSCPSCGSTMVRRTARKGPNAGSDFWGCPRFPDCRGKRQIGEPYAGV